MNTTTSDLPNPAGAQKIYHLHDVAAADEYDSLSDPEGTIRW